MQQIRIQKQRTKQRRRHTDIEQTTPTQPAADTTAAGELLSRIDDLLGDSES